MIEATIEGDVITGYINGVKKITTVDDTWKTGAPGIGFNFGVGDTYNDHGLSSLRGRDLRVGPNGPTGSGPADRSHLPRDRSR